MVTIHLLQAIAPKKKARSVTLRAKSFFLTGPTRLELATSCVTGRRSNQLNYDPRDKLKSYTSFERKKIGAVRKSRPDWFRCCGNQSRRFNFGRSVSLGS